MIQQLMRPERPSRSAEVTCFMRAAEQLRPAAQRMLDDPLAERFLGRGLRLLLAAARRCGWAPDDPLGMTGYVVARHRSIDDCLLAAAASGEPIEQVVLLGAGYDTRAFRLSARLRGQPVFFELDHPTTSRRKAALLEQAVAAQRAGCERRAVPIDFARQALGPALRAAGFAPARGTFFIWEGVTMYLPQRVVRATLVELGRLAHGRCELAVELWQGHASAEPWVALANRAGTLGLRLACGEPVLFGLPAGEAQRFFGGLGLALVELADGRLLRRRYAGGRRIWPGNYVAHVRCARGRHS